MKNKNLDDDDADRKMIVATFYLENDDTISIEGSSVLHIFFELNARFPEKFNFSSVEFSGSNSHEKFRNLEKFQSILRRYM